MQAVDDLVEGVVNTLNSPTPDGANPLDNTYIFFTSDNGYHHGEHRIPRQKWRPYEEDVHMPLLVRGPGVRAGSWRRSSQQRSQRLPLRSARMASEATHTERALYIVVVVHKGPRT